MSDGDSGEGLSQSQDRRLNRLLGRKGSADYELDLTGLDWAHAVGSVDRMVERQRFRSEDRSVSIRIDPATAESGATLFGPLGRHLLDLMRRGLVARVTPLTPDQGAGFDVILPAGKDPSAALLSIEEVSTLADLAPDGEDEDPA